MVDPQTKEKLRVVGAPGFDPIPIRISYAKGLPKVGFGLFR